MSNPGMELASLDFGNLNGGPLRAVITAQSYAAEATTNFYKGCWVLSREHELTSEDVWNTSVYVDLSE